MNDKEIRRKVNNMNVKFDKDRKCYFGRLTINNKRHIKRGKTKTEVRDKMTEHLRNVARGYKNPKKITLNEYTEYWLKRYKKASIEASSYEKLESVYTNQVKNSIGRKMIGDITSADIQNLINEHASPTKKDTKALARSGLKRLHQLLAASFSQAVKDEVISVNPCEDIFIPKESNILVKKKKQISLSDSEIEIFKRECLAKYKTREEYKSRDALVLLVILNLGLRIGEMLALKWSDIDFDDSFVRIARTVQVSKEKGRIEKEPKTRNGIRILSMNDSVKHYLKELQAYDERNNICSEYVCCTTIGTTQNQRNMQRSLDRVLRRTSISEKVSLHTLRHTFGSTMLRRGVKIETVSKLMGHANISITYDNYIHTIKELEAQAMTLVTVA